MAPGVAAKMALGRVRGNLARAPRSAPRVTRAHDLPLIERFPSLGDVARAPLGVFPSPVEHVRTDGVSDAFWVKRDDRNAGAFAGNKLRALEFLLADLAPGEALLTIGGEGSTHILTTAAWGAVLGAPTFAGTWPHEMGPVARRVADEIPHRCRRVYRYRSVHAAAAGVTLVRQRARLSPGERLRWVPFGGTSPLGMLGHVSSGLELARQIERGALPTPDEIFVPLGTGGTAAGIALGLSIGGVSSKVVAVRVGPRIGIEGARLTWLAWRVVRLLARHGVRAIDAWHRLRVAVHHSAFGGAYGRPHPEAERVSAAVARTIGATLDSTYSAKTCYAALVDRRPAGHTLFWLTFDGRWMDEHAAVTR